MAGVLDWSPRPHAQRGRGLAGAGRRRPGGRGRARRRPRARGLPRRRSPSAPTPRCGGERSSSSGSTRAPRARAASRSTTSCASAASRPCAVASLVPRPGLVEQDPEAIAASAEQRDRRGAGRRGRRPARRRGARDRQPDRDVRGLGARDSGRARPPGDRVAGPAHRRGLRRAARARGAGARAHRARARRDVPGDEAALAARPGRGDGDLAYGDVASLAAAPPRPASTCATRATRAARCCARSAARDWDDELLELFGIPRALLPPIVDSDAIDAEIAGVPVRAAVGRPAGVAVRAALLGARRREGDARHRRVRARPGGRRARRARRPGILASCAWRREGARATRSRASSRRPARRVDWFARIGALPAGPELDALLREPGAGGVVCVPALQGLGSPTWDAGARGALLGLSLGTTRADLARAVVDGILHQVADAVEPMGVARGAVGRRRPLALGLDRPAPRRPHRRRASGARPAPTRPRSAPPPWPASPPASGTGPTRCPRSRSTWSPSRRSRRAERARERERWAAARELTAAYARQE